MDDRSHEDRMNLGRDIDEVCPRGAIDESLEGLCPRDAIDRDAADVCPRESIDRAAADVCPKDAIDASADDICGKEQIDRAAAGVCGASSSPIIGIVPTQVPEERIFRVNDYYINSIVLSGGVPLILPLAYDKRVYERLFPIVDGFVLTGGQDVDPGRYGASADDAGYDKLSEITPMRDMVETAILDYAYTFDVPLLGTCRGMQTMNVYFGGTLYLDLDEEFSGVDNLTGKPIVHWQTEEPTEVSHYIDVERGSKLHEILQADSSAANSFHHQAVKKVGEGFRPVAYASDGLVEAIEAVDRTFMLGVQWHPEFFLGEKHMGNLFSRLVREAVEARESGRLDGHEDYRIENMQQRGPQHGLALLHAIKKTYSL